MVNIGLLGLGTVGTGIVQIIEDRKNYLEKLIGTEINISKILIRDIDKKRRIGIHKDKLTTDFSEIVGDQDIDIIIEVMGGLEEAYVYIREALNRGKHVVTANKAVVAKHLEELTFLAREKNKAFLYEASVGGGIPIIKQLKEQANLNNIQEIKGILNGTSNFLLTKMIEEDLDFKEALKMSQKLGYAEADPTDDIEGYDTRRKLRILTTIGFKDRVKEESILCQGISSIKTIDIQNIKSMDCTIKLLGTATLKDNKYYALVEPVIIKKNSYFGKVDYATNLVSFVGNKVGELRFYGEGAGSFPTANAILSDVIDIILKNYHKNYFLESNDLDNINKLFQGRYYIRTTLENDTKDKMIRYINEKEITDKLITKEKDVAFITKKILKKEIENIISKFNIRTENYFIGRLEV